MVRRLARPGGSSMPSIPTAATGRLRTRGNARGVDLNRNSPWRWRTLDPPGGTFYAGPRAQSEPETRAVLRLVRRVRPDVTVWFHQRATLVDLSRGDRRIIRAMGGRSASRPGTSGRALGALPPGRPRRSRGRRRSSWSSRVAPCRRRRCGRTCGRSARSRRAPGASPVAVSGRGSPRAGTTPRRRGCRR